MSSRAIKKWSDRAAGKDLYGTDPVAVEQAEKRLKELRSARNARKKARKFIATS